VIFTNATAPKQAKDTKSAGFYESETFLTGLCL
jgi:hypothetical protein